ncbi:phage tail tape measure protein [Azoarcus sp. PA01]|nr:phage tail tape measure protein [Azoarcus sp. PA01]
MANKVVQLIIGARDEASSVFTSLQTKVAAVGAAIATYFSAKLFGDAVGAAREFESAMSAVQAAAGASGGELDALRAAAESAGATTKYSSVEAAGALENLAKAGLSATDAVKTLPAVLDLAAAGGIELGTASDYISKAVAGMGLSFSEAGRVADVLAMGANASNTSVDGLAQALSYAAPLANSLGLSLEQTVAIIGKFADAGIDASRAGTALNSILAQFSDPASKFRQELAAAGIITNDFDQALRQLAAAGPAGQAAINAVGQEAGPALRALLNQGIGSLDALKAKLDESAGSAKSFAAVMSDNLDGAAKGFGSAWDALLIKLGTPVLDILKGQINAIAERLRGFVTDGTATAFGNAIKAAFESAGKWAAEFFAKVDFTQLAANLQAFAARAGEVFTAIGNHATTAGGVLQTAYGVMSTGLNTVLAAIYKVGEGASWLASAFLADLALISDGISKITFGSLSDGFAQAAASMRAEAQAAYAVSDEFARKSTEAFSAAAVGAETAANGWKTLTSSAAEAVPAVSAAGAAVKTVGEQATLSADQLDALGNGAQFVAGEVTKAGSAAATAAPQLRDLGTDAAAASQQVEAAFSRLGVTSQAALETAAANARRDFDIIRNSGTATARDIQAAFAAYAAKAIEANGGVANEALKSEAAMYKLRIEADETGKAIVRGMDNGANALDHLRQKAEEVASKIGMIKREASGLKGVWDENGNLIDPPSGGGSDGKSYSSPFLALYARAEQIGGLTFRKEIEQLYLELGRSMERKTVSGADWVSKVLGRMTEAVDAEQMRKERQGSSYGPAPQRAAVAPAAAPETVTRYEVSVNVGNTRRTINTAGAADAQALVSMLQQLEQDMARSAR